MKLINLKLDNFKGIRNLEINFDGKNVCIYGDNATGKTTIIDAWLWLLFDKDSENKKDFGVKTIIDGEVLHGLDHSVEANIMLDSKPLRLQKIFKEKWVKKKGSADREFSGHTTDYFIDEVPTKKKEYDDKIKEIANEDIFRLISDVRHFNQNLKWGQRREMLLNICGDITDKDIIESKPELSKLAEIINNRSVEDHKAVLKATRKKINEELEKIPVRIDEVAKSIEEISEIETDKVNAEIKRNEKEIEELKTKKINLQNGSLVTETRKKIAEVETEKREALNKHNESEEQKKEPLHLEMLTAKEALRKKNDELSNIEYQIKQKNATMQRLLDERQALLNSWHEFNNKVFEYNSICPTCGQDMPEEKKETARTNFNKNKSTELEKIQTTGKAKKEEIEKIQDELNKISSEKTKLENELIELDKVFKEKNEVVEKFNSFRPVFDSSAYDKETRKLNDILENSKTANNEEIAKIAASIDDINEKIRELKKLITLSDQRKSGIKRIDELKQRERELAEEFQNTEQELFLCEEFTREKVYMLEERINNKFKYARFKLFKDLINGGLEECCETLYNDIPYSDLNNASRLNVGIDIINTLSKYYNVSAPVFVDNSESVTKLLESEGQQIKLIVSAEDKNLRIVEN